MGVAVSDSKQSGAGGGHAYSLSGVCVQRHAAAQPMRLLSKETVIQEVRSPTTHPAGLLNQELTYAIVLTCSRRTQPRPHPYASRLSRIMIQPYKFIFSSKSLIAPIREDSGFCAIIPDWAQLNKTAIDPQVLEETRLTDERSANIRLGIICHAYNVTAEHLESVARFAVNCNPSAIIITSDTQFKLFQVQEHLKTVVGFSGFCKTIILPNVGRDVLPFWFALQEIALHADVFVKLHWKKSPHYNGYLNWHDKRRAYQAWNEDILHSLLPTSQEELADILSILKTQNIACIYPKPWAPVERTHWHCMDNLQYASQQLSSLSLPQAAAFLPLIYPLGNMFYGSVPFFMNFAAQFISNTIPPPEPVPADGTVLHATERIYTLLAACSGHDVAVIYPPAAKGTSKSEMSSKNEERRLILFPVADLLASSISPLPSNQPAIQLPVLYHTLVTGAIRNSLPFRCLKLQAFGIASMLSAVSTLKQLSHWLRGLIDRKLID